MTCPPQSVNTKGTFSAASARATTLPPWMYPIPDDLLSCAGRATADYTGTIPGWQRRTTFACVTVFRYNSRAMERSAERKNVAPMPRRGTSADPKLEVLRRVVAEAPVVVWAFDRNGIFTLIEGKALERLGDRMRLHVGQSIFDVYAGNPRIMDACRRVLRGEPFTDVAVVGDMAFETQWVPMQIGRAH